jgi:hypothetical protein
LDCGISDIHDYTLKRTDLASYPEIQEDENISKYFHVVIQYSWRSVRRSRGQTRLEHEDRNRNRNRNEIYKKTRGEEKKRITGNIAVSQLKATATAIRCGHVYDQGTA